MARERDVYLLPGTRDGSFATICVLCVLFDHIRVLRDAGALDARSVLHISEL